jgi:hypothetical protein
MSEKTLLLVPDPHGNILILKQGLRRFPVDDQFRDIFLGRVDRHALISGKNGSSPICGELTAGK